MKTHIISALAVLMTALMTALVTACSQGEAATPSKLETPPLSAKLPPLSGAPIWVLNQEESRLGFNANYNGPISGSFKRFDAAIRFDPDNLETAEIHVIVALGSVRAKDSDVTENLPLPEWFDAAKFPIARFSATEISRDASLGYKADGLLTLKGITQPVTLEFDLNIEGKTAAAKGTAMLSRTDFNVGTGPDFQDESWVKFPVEITFDINAQLRKSENE